MEANVMNYNKSKLNFFNWAKMGFLSGISQIKGNMGTIASRQLMNIVWKNYFKDSENTPDADSNWLNGITSTAMIETRKSIIKSEIKLTNNNSSIPLMIIYGESDIYEDKYDSIYYRYSQSQNIILKDSGHLPWLQSDKEFYNILENFYGELNNEK